MESSRFLWFENFFQGPFEQKGRYISWRQSRFFSTVFQFNMTTRSTGRYYFSKCPQFKNLEPPSAKNFMPAPCFRYTSITSSDHLLMEKTIIRARKFALSDSNLFRLTGKRVQERTVLPISIHGEKFSGGQDPLWPLTAPVSQSCWRANFLARRRFFYRSEKGWKTGFFETGSFGDDFLDEIPNFPLRCS